MFRELINEEIEGIIYDFGEMMCCVIEVGFDGVEIYGVNNYLI